MNESTSAVLKVQCRNENALEDDQNSAEQPHLFTIATGITDDTEEGLDDKFKRWKLSEEDISTKHRVTTSQQCVVLSGACLNTFIALGFLFSVGALYVEIINVYSATRSQASLIQSLGIGILFGAGIITGIIVDWLGVKIPLISGGILGFLGLFSSWFATSLLYLTLTIGVVTGFGGSLVYMSTSVLVTSTFNTGRRLALPGLICAAGAGSIIFPKVLEFLLAEYGLRGALLVSSGLFLNIIPSGLIITSHLGIVGEKRKQTDSKDLKRQPMKKKLKFLKNCSLLSFMLTAAVGFGTMNGVLVAMVDLIESRGYSTDVGIQLLLIYSSVNTVTRLVSGLLKLIPGMHGAVIYSISLIICSASLILLRTTTDYTTILFLIIMFGVGYGGIVGIYPFTILEFVGHEFFPFALGFSSFLNGVSNATGAALMGLMYDVTTSYELPLLIYGIVGNSAAVLTLLTMGCSLMRRSCGSKVYAMN